MSSTRHPFLRRIAMWTAVMALFLTLYVAGVPFVGFWAVEYAPRTVPAVRAFYAPYSVYVLHRNWPGSSSLEHYESWCASLLREQRIESEGVARKLRKEQSDVEFHGTPLGDVARFMSRLHEYPIELDDSADPNLQITITASAPLGDVLEQMVGPHGLVAAADRERVIIGTPEGIEKLRAAARGNQPLNYWKPGLLLLGVVMLAVAGLQLRRRFARSSGRSSE